MNTELLDTVLPLKGASHADVDHYGVDIPMRYSECYARLVDGRVVRLRNTRQFVGWTGVNGSRRLLFDGDGSEIELRRGSTRGFEVDKPQSGCKYIARDGSLHFTR